MNINELIASRLKALRNEQGFSLAALAERSGVSRSNISLIERGESSATATVLDKLAAALNVTVAALFEDKGETTAPSPISRVAEQPVWTDPVTGYVRRNLSPAAPSPLQLVDVTFPPGQRIAYDTSRDVDIHQQVWMIEGVMEMTVGDEHWRLETGDCLAMRLDRSIVYHNPTSVPARYLVAMVTPSPHQPRRN